MVYSLTEDDFEAAWQRLMKEFGDDQEAVVLYLEGTWLPVRHQWANCYTL